MNRSSQHFSLLACLALVLGSLQAGETGRQILQSTPESKRPAEAIQDNSFLVEEAYNQGPGVVQHIFTAFGSVNKLRGDDDREWALGFTQEWPVISQTHQFSYTIPYSFIGSGGADVNGIGDILLNYRLQLTMETASRPAI